MTPGAAPRGRGWIAAVALFAVPFALQAAAWTAPAAAPARATRHAVEIRGFLFRPSPLEVAVGDTVVWTNRDLVPHAVGAAGGGWRSGDIPAGGAWRLVARGKGRVEYDCPLHPTMKGMLVVR